MMKTRKNYLVPLKIPERKEIYSTHGENILLSTNRTEMEIISCMHEEADSQLMTHLMDACTC